jgi:hypothetical protein
VWATRYLRWPGAVPATDDHSGFALDLTVPT